jgi:hypothetical protein
LDNVKISAITGDQTSNSLILSVKELTPGATDSIHNNFKDPLDIANNNSLYKIDAPAGKPFDPYGGDDGLDFEEIVPHVQYWRERF